MQQACLSVYSKSDLKMNLGARLGLIKINNKNKIIFMKEDETKCSW